MKRIKNISARKLYLQYSYKVTRHAKYFRLNSESIRNKLEKIFCYQTGKKKLKSRIKSILIGFEECLKQDTKPIRKFHCLLIMKEKITIASQRVLDLNFRNYPYPAVQGVYEPIRSKKEMYAIYTKIKNTCCSENLQVFQSEWIELKKEKDDVLPADVSRSTISKLIEKINKIDKNLNSTIQRKRPLKQRENKDLFYYISIILMFIGAIFIFAVCLTSISSRAKR
jgi:ABC-type antimicrobial peptide transport system permease subunit